MRAPQRYTATMRILGLILLCAVLPATASGLYRWVDAEGRVHYTQTPPPQGTFEPLAPAPPPPPPSTGLTDFAREQDAARAKAREEKLKADQSGAEKARLCEQARQRAAYLETQIPRRLGTIDADGKAVRMNEEEFARRKQAAAEAVQQACS